MPDSNATNDDTGRAGKRDGLSKALEIIDNHLGPQEPERPLEITAAIRRELKSVVDGSQRSLGEPLQNESAGESGRAGFTSCAACLHSDWSEVRHA
jgi:hypothetical protein